MSNMLDVANEVTARERETLKILQNMLLPICRENTKHKTQKQKYKLRVGDSTVHQTKNTILHLFEATMHASDQFKSPKSFPK